MSAVSIPQSKMQLRFHHNNTIRMKSFCTFQLSYIMYQSHSLIKQYTSFIFQTGMMTSEPQFAIVSKSQILKNRIKQKANLMQTFYVVGKQNETEKVTPRCDYFIEIEQQQPAYYSTLYMGSWGGWKNSFECIYFFRINKLFVINVKINMSGRMLGFISSVNNDDCK